MKAKILGLLAMGLLVITSVDAEAYFLDTGIVSAPSDARSAYRAGEFELTSATTITSLSRWMQIDGAGLLAFQILSNASNLPGNVLFSTSPHATSQTGGAPAWVGVDGLNWSLGAGTYWFAVAQPGPGPAQILLPFCDTMANPGCVANPLTNEAVFSFASQTWGERSARGGWRINVPLNVPEPGTLALLGLGLAGLRMSRRRKA